MVAKIHAASDNLNADGNLDVKIDARTDTFALPVLDANGKMDTQVAITNANGAPQADFISSTDDDGAVTVNSVSGQVILAAGDTAVVVTNSEVGVSSIILLSKLSNDATAVDFKVETNVAGGEFTITAAAAATADVLFNFFVVKVNDLTPA